MDILKFSRQLFHLTVFYFGFSFTLSAQTDPIEAAKPFLAQKNFDKAAEVYENWLAKYPNDANIWRELGVAQSWGGQHLKSIEAFKKSLELSQSNLEAQRGLAYAYAWRGDYGRARELFEAILKTDASDEQAQKGLAYLALWSGNGERATQQFADLARRFPQNAEYQLTLAQACKMTGENARAARAYRAAKRLAPENPIPKRELTTLRTEPVFAEADIWGGYSRVATSDSDGLRLLQLALQLRHDYSVYARLDKSLSVDNLDLLRRNVRGNVYNIGAFHSWNEKTGTTIEAGLREFGKAQASQYTIRGEQTYAIANGFQLKAGLMAGFGNNTQTEWVILAGGHFPVARYLALEPTFFFTRLNAFSFDHRFALNTKIMPGQGYELNIGVLAGSAQIENEATLRKMTGAYFVGIAPISKPIWLMFSYRYEDGFFDQLNTAALGVRLRFGQSR